MIDKPNYNNYRDVPKFPYLIFSYLMENDNLFKLLKYDTADALSKPNLTIDEKREMLYVDNENKDETQFNVFLKPLVSDELTKQCTQLRIYKTNIAPTNRLMSVLAYRFDTIIGSKMGLIYDEDDIPCSRVDRIESEILSTLNGADIGIGRFSFDREVSRLCSANLGISNSKTFYGSSIVMACYQANIDESGC